MHAVVLPLCIAALAGCVLAVGVTTLPAGDAQVQAAVRVAQNAINRNAPRASNVTSVISATKQAAGAGSSRVAVTFKVTNTTCAPPVLDWTKCCQRGEPKTCNATFTCGKAASSCLLNKLDCGSGGLPSRSCPGCITQLTDLAALSNITHKTVALYAPANAANAVTLISASQQVVSGIKYFLEVLVNYPKQVQLCKFQVLQQSWITPDLKILNAACSACKQP